MELEEFFTPVVGYEGFYEIGTAGSLASLNYGRTGKRVLMNPYKNKDGYMGTILSKNGEHEYKTIHELVADTYIPNPDNLPEVGHWDCDPSNNRVENLYRCTHEENVNNPITKERHKGHEVTEETRKKISEKQIGKIVSEETRKKISEALKGKKHTPWNKGKTGLYHHSEETRKKISIANKGKIVSEETRKKLSESNKGRVYLPLSDESKKKLSENVRKIHGMDSWKEYMREKMTNRKDKSKTVIQLTIDGDFVKEYESLREAQRQTGIPVQNISSVCNGKFSQAGGYKWEFKYKEAI